jgi:hypothetical protein
MVLCPRCRKRKTDPLDLWVDLCQDCLADTSEWINLRCLLSADNSRKRWLTGRPPPPAPHLPDSPAELLGLVEDMLRRLREKVAEGWQLTRPTAGMPWSEAWFLFFIYNDSLPPVTAIWAAMTGMPLGGVPPCPGEPEDAAEALNALQLAAECLRRHPTGQMPQQAVEGSEGEAPACPVGAEDDHQQASANGNSIQRVAEVWHLRYQGEQGDYPVKGNQCIGWLAKLLVAPNRSLTVADLRGDPEGKLAADALLGAERETDNAGIKAIRKRLEEIEDIAEQAGGWSEHLEKEREDLLDRVKEAEDGKQLRSSLNRAHHNIASQIRTFLRDKLPEEMPQLAAHLNQSLKLEFPSFGYYPPAGTPAWKV